MKLRLLFTLTLAWAAASASAIQPVTWTHTTEADFADGETDHTIVTNLGEIKLATGSRVLGEAPEGVTVIYDIARVRDTLYLAAGPEGRILKLDDDQLVEVASLEGEQVFALAPRDGRLIVAVSGQETSRLAILGDAGLEMLVELPGVRYVWDVVHLERDAFVVATGIEGKVLRVTTGDGAVTELLDAEQVNVLSLALADDGTLYAGTDTDGLVYRIAPNEQTGEYESFVILDAEEPEIGALLVDGDVVYAGTADAEQARPGRLGDAAGEETGRPAGEPAATKAPQDDEAPEGPIEPEVPGAEPEPQPIDEPESDASEPSAEEVDVVEASDEPQAPPAPTPQQYDALRDLMRQRLEEARKSGKLQVEGLAGPAGGQPMPAASQRARPQRAPARKKDGNAVYRIDADGFVREVFRESVMILKLIRPAPTAAPAGSLVVLTGNQGQVYRVDPAKDETTVLIDLDSEQLVAALVRDDGAILLGGANPAQLIALSHTYAPTGTYTSKVLDAAQVSLFGTLTVTGRIPAGSSVTVETRSGNTADPKIAAWSPWSAAQVFMPDPDLPELQPREMKIASPPARFLQYRLTLTGDASDSPAVDRIEATYVTPNLRPTITSLKAAYPEPKRDQPPATEMNIEWEAADANTDPLIYKIEYRPAGSDRFLLLAEDVTETSHAWQTRHVPDGRYVLRVTADDRPANPAGMALTSARISDPVLVDNTPPTIDAEIAIEAGTLRITGTVTDRFSKVRSLAYKLDDDEQFTPILPQDLIFDSTSEAFAVTIPDLAAGPHVVTLRATDTRGNTAHKAVLID